MENKAPLSGWQRIGVTGRGRTRKGVASMATSWTPDDPQHEGGGGGVEPQRHQARERLLLWVWIGELKGI